MNQFFTAASLAVAVSVTVLVAGVSNAQAQEGWKNESQVGLVQTSGNTDTSTLSASQITTYTFSQNAFRFTGGYLYQETSDVVSAKAWNLGLRYERELSNRFSIFAAETVQSDKFKDLRQGYNTDIGAKYFFSKEDTLTWFGEAGYRFTRQNATIANSNLHFARLYTEIEKKFSPSVSVKYWLEFLPNFSVSEDWQANSEISVSALLTQVFSVKSAYLLKFDHLPNAAGLKPADKVLTTSLVAKF